MPPMSFESKIIADCLLLRPNSFSISGRFTEVKPLKIPRIAMGIKCTLIGKGLIEGEREKCQRFFAWVIEICKQRSNRLLEIYIGYEIYKCKVG